MYIPAKNCLVILTPKCGTTTMRAALEEKYGKLPLPGHLSEKQQIDKLAEQGIKPDYSVVIWRDPVERFLSAFNHVYSDWRDFDEALSHALHTGRASQRVFHSQRAFLDGNIPRKVFNFPPHEAMAHFGIDAVPHKNASKKRWTMEHLAPRLDEIEAHVAGDVEFFNGLQKEEVKEVRLTKSGKPDRRFKRAS